MFRTIVMPGVAVSMVFTGWAQETAAEPLMIVATGLGESVEVSPAVPAGERRPVLAKAWQMLGRLAERRPDGLARTLHRCDGVETWVEWKGLTISGMAPSELDVSDWENGVTRRYRCLVSAGFHRIWQADRIAWSAWIPGSYEPFPRIIEVARTGGEWVASTVHAGDFIPPAGGGSSSAGNGIVRVGASGEGPRVVMGR